MSIGLMEFQFQLNYNTTKLDEWPLDSLRLAGIIAGKRRKTNDIDSLDMRERYLKGEVLMSHLPIEIHILISFSICLPLL